VWVPPGLKPGADWPVRPSLFRTSHGTGGFWRGEFRQGRHAGGAVGRRCVCVNFVPSFDTETVARRSRKGGERVPGFALRLSLRGKQPAHGESGRFICPRAKDLSGATDSRNGPCAASSRVMEQLALAHSRLSTGFGQGVVRLLDPVAVKSDGGFISSVDNGVLR